MVLSSRELLTCDCYLSMTVCLCENWKLCVCVCVCVRVCACACKSAYLTGTRTCRLARVMHSPGSFPTKEALL